MKGGIFMTDIKRVIGFSKEEFLKYAKLTFTDFDIIREKTDIYIGLNENGDIENGENDAIFIDVKGNKGVITGSNAGSVLIAVYRFFIECGCRFLRPGKDGEYINQCTLSEVKVYVKEKATSNKRGLVIEGGCSFENVYDIIDFCPKIALNTYEFQFMYPTAFFKRWYEHGNNPFKESENVSEEEMKKQIDIMKDEVKKRGLTLETMGHGFTTYPFGLDAGGWEKNNEKIDEETLSLMALVNGKRGLMDAISFNTNVCCSNPKVKEKMTDFLVDYCKNNPQVDVVKFALADNTNVACECENCTKLRLSDHYVNILNYMDEKLTESGLPQKISLGVYLDLLWAPIKERIKNKDRFLFGIYPISHTYHEPINIDKIPNEEPYPYIVNQLSFSENPNKDMAFLKKWQEVCPYDWYVGEYHYMWDHYSDIGYQQIAKTLHTDICNQKKLGLNGMVMYQPQRCSFPTGMGLYTYGKTLWNNKVSFEEISEDYFKHAFGEGWEYCYKHLQTLSDTYDMKIKPGGRDYLHTDIISTMEKCLKIVEEFNKNVKEPTHKSALEEISWSDVHRQNVYIEKFFNAIITGYKEDKQKGEEMINDLVNWMWKHEDEVQPRWDIGIHARFIMPWYKRIFEMQERELRGEKKSDIVLGVNNGAGAEGVQAQ